MEFMSLKIAMVVDNMQNSIFLNIITYLINIFIFSVTSLILFVFTLERRNKSTKR